MRASLIVCSQPSPLRHLQGHDDVIVHTEDSLFRDDYFVTALLLHNVMLETQSTQRGTLKSCILPRRKSFLHLRTAVSTRRVTPPVDNATCSITTPVLQCALKREKKKTACLAPWRTLSPRAAAQLLFSIATARHSSEDDNDIDKL